MPTEFEREVRTALTTLSNQYAVISTDIGWIRERMTQGDEKLGRHDSDIFALKSDSRFEAGKHAAYSTLAGFLSGAMSGFLTAMFGHRPLG